MGSFVRDGDHLRPAVDWRGLQEERLARARRLMRAEGLDAVLSNHFENVLYLANWPRWSFETLFANAFSVLFAPEMDEPVVFCLQADAAAAKQDGVFRDLRPLPSGYRRWPPLYAKAIADYGLAGKRIALDPNTTGWLYANLPKLIPEVEFVEGGKFFSQLRLIKNAEEIRAYEFVIGRVEGALSLAARMGRESWGRYTEVEISAAANRELLRRGFARTNIWCPSGPNTAPVRRYPTDRAVRAQELFLIDGGGSLDALRAEYARTIWTGGGRPPADLRRIFQTLVKAHQAMREVLRPGVRTAAVERANLKVIEDAGFREVYGGYPYTGHGIGVGGAEPPFITAEFPEHDIPLEAGMLFNVEPGIWIPGTGGIRIEETYVITETGYRVLSQLPYDEDLAG